MAEQEAISEGAVMKNGKSRHAFRTISEVSSQLGVPAHVLRFWETKFAQIKPLKRGGNRRYYRPEDVLLIKAIKHHLYNEGFTIKGAVRLMKEKGVKEFVDDWKQEFGKEHGLGHDREPDEAMAQEQESPVESKVPEKPLPPPDKPKIEVKPPEPPPPLEPPKPDVNKEIIEALVDDLKALKDLVNKLPDK